MGERILSSGDLGLSLCDLGVSPFDFGPSLFDLELSLCDLGVSLFDLGISICDLGLSLFDLDDLGVLFLDVSPFCLGGATRCSSYDLDGTTGWGVCGTQSIES